MNLGDIYLLEVTDVSFLIITSKRYKSDEQFSMEEGVPCY
jgi:hypothetical protein